MSEKKLLFSSEFDPILFATAIFEYSDLAIFLVMVHGENNFTYQGLNPTHERLTGLRSTDIKDKHPHDFLPSELADVIVAHYEECRKKKTTIVYEETIPFQGKDTFWLTRLIPLLNEENEVTQIIGASINIDDRKAMENNLLSLVEFNQKILSLSHAGLLIFDQNGFCITMNEAAQTILNIKNTDELLSKPLTELHPTHATIWERAWKEKLTFSEIQIATPDGNNKWVSLQSIPYHHNNKPLLLVTVTDITPLKIHQQELEEKNQLIMNLLEHLPNPVIAFKENGNVCFFNKSFLKEFGNLLSNQNNLSVDNIHTLFKGDLYSLYPNTTTHITAEVSLQKNHKTYLIEQYFIGQPKTENCRILWSFNDISKQKATIKKLEKELHKDFLTGLYNRRGLEEILPIEWKRALREKKPLSFLMIDIDYFKNYNDSLGHLEGDNCLREVAHILKDTCYRPGDFTFRYGGEEFLILLTNTPLDGAQIVANRIHETLKQRPIPHPASPIAPILTVSIGIISLVPSLQNWKTALKHADQALYSAKQAGRNTTRVYFTLPNSPPSS